VASGVPLGAALAAMCVAFAISGCANDEGGSERSEVAELLDHVPGEQPHLMFADFAAAREQLGLPETPTSRSSVRVTNPATWDGGGSRRPPA
jgi:hypothetical protein